MTLTRIPRFRSGDSLIKFCRQDDVRTHFFDRDAMNFFSSRVHYVVTAAGSTPTVWHGVVVTSEQFDDDSPRLYTVRRFTLGLELDGTVYVEDDTVGDFQEHARLGSAMVVAEREADR